MCMYVMYLACLCVWNCRLPFWLDPQLAFVYGSKKFWKIKDCIERNWIYALRTWWKWCEKAPMLHKFLYFSTRFELEHGGQFYLDRNYSPANYICTYSCDSPVTYLRIWHYIALNALRREAATHKWHRTSVITEEHWRITTTTLKVISLSSIVWLHTYALYAQSRMRLDCHQ